MNSYHCDRPAPAAWLQRAPQPHTEVLWLHPVNVNQRGKLRWLMLNVCRDGSCEIRRDCSS
jgi:hypothetical protein